MRILLLGEYSNVHATLAEGLRSLGHEVTVASNGDFWKNYPRDIDFARRPGKAGGMVLALKIFANLHRMKGYDIVQFINPIFLELKAEHIFKIYSYLKKHNRRTVLCGLGMDWYWVNTCVNDKPLRYSDFNIGNTIRNNTDAVREMKDWLGTSKERLNRLIAGDADAIITGLYEYQACYERHFPEKTFFIPMPIKTEPVVPFVNTDGRLHIFIGINKTRSEYKGTDIMLKAAEAITKEYPQKAVLKRVESVPFAEYKNQMNRSDAILDQLYSYTPAMNALLAMSKGIICIGGGEKENYTILNENKLRPIINVHPDEDSVYDALKELILSDKERILELKRQSIEYVAKHHDYIKVARQYEKIYKSII